MSYAGQILDQHTSRWENLLRVRLSDAERYAEALVVALRAEGIEGNVGLLSGPMRRVVHGLDAEPVWEPAPSEWLLIRFVTHFHTTQQVVVRHRLFGSWLERAVDSDSDDARVWAKINRAWQRAGLPHPDEWTIDPPSPQPDPSKQEAA